MTACTREGHQREVVTHTGNAPALLACPGESCREAACTAALLLRETAALQSTVGQTFGPGSEADVGPGRLTGAGPGGLRRARLRACVRGERLPRAESPFQPGLCWWRGTGRGQHRPSPSSAAGPARRGSGRGAPPQGGSRSHSLSPARGGSDAPITAARSLRRRCREQKGFSAAAPPSSPRFRLLIG